MQTAMIASESTPSLFTLFFFLRLQFERVCQTLLLSQSSYGSDKAMKGGKKSRTSSNISAKPFSQHPHITAIVLFHLLLQLSHNILANIFNSYDTERPLEKRGETAHRERRLGRTCAAASRRNGTKKKVVWTLDSETHKHHSIRAQLQKSTISLSVEQDETYGRQEISLRTSQVGRATANKGDCSTSFMWFFFFEHAHTQNADSLSINALRRLWHWSPYWGKKKENRHACTTQRCWKIALRVRHISAPS